MRTTVTYEGFNNNADCSGSNVRCTAHPSALDYGSGNGSQKQSGLGAVAGGVSELLLSPVFWIMALLFFFFFLRMSKVGNDAVRILFFWIPTVAASCIGLLFVTGFTYLFLHF
jgi:hypothetical protein